jgi:hypothetical protein
MNNGIMRTNELNFETLISWQTYLEQSKHDIGQEYALFSTPVH